METFLKYLIRVIQIAKVSLALGCFSLLIPLQANPSQEKTPEVAVAKIEGRQEDYGHWKKFHSVAGKCKVSFPQNPEHVKQMMKIEEDQYDMQYDVYVATELGKETVFMVLIAQYPPYVNESCAELSLECFLNGILTQHPQNQLIFADLIEFQGHKGMDFFIKTKGVFFKGRAVMSGSNLYLVAMECEEGSYKDHQFNFFINSFELDK